MKKRIISVVVAMTSFALLAMGSGSSTPSTSNTGNEITNVQTNNVQKDTDVVKNGDSEKTTPIETLKPTIEEKVVFDDKDIKITAVEYSTDSFWGDGIKFLIENNTSQDITVGTNATIVNNFMVADLFVAEVAAGKKTNETLTLSSSQLKAAGIEDIGLIEVYFHIFDSDSWSNICDTDCIEIKTSLYDQMDTIVDDAGQVLYNENGIKIIGKYVNESDFWGKAIMLYTENTSGRNVMITTEDVSINGFTFGSAVFSSTVYDGKKSYDSITLFSTELEENGISSVDEVSLKFNIVDPDTYSTIKQSDEIVFSTK